jgi:hypothetical protein
MLFAPSNGDLRRCGTVIAGRAAEVALSKTEIKAGPPMLQMWLGAIENYFPSG